MERKRSGESDRGTEMNMGASMKPMTIQQTEAQVAAERMPKGCVKLEAMG